MSLATSAIAAPRRRPWLVFAVATVALVYAAVMHEHQLLDLLAETWHRGHDMR